MAWMKSIGQRLSRWMVAMTEAAYKGYAPQLECYTRWAQPAAEQQAAVSQKQSSEVKAAGAQELEPAKA